MRLPLVTKTALLRLCRRRARPEPAQSNATDALRMLVLGLDDPPTGIVVQQQINGRTACHPAVNVGLRRRRGLGGARLRASC